MRPARDAPTSAAPPPCPVASAARPTPSAPGYVCEECFGPLEVAYVRRLADPRRDRGRAAARSGATAPCSRCPPTWPLPRASRRAARSWSGPTTWPRARPARRCGSRTTAATRRTRSRTASSPWRCPPRGPLGLDTLACASTGNLANAVAAAAARAGLRSVVVIPSDLEAGKVITTAVYGGTLVAVEGTYDDVNRLCSEIAGEESPTGWGFVNVNLRAYYAEGSKTVGYEIAEDLGWRLPVAGRLARSRRGRCSPRWTRRSASSGRSGSSRPRRTGSSARRPPGCSPVAQAFRAGHDVVRPVRPDTIAKSLAIGNPADGPYALDVCRRTGGAVEDVSDAEVVEGIQLLAETEGIFAETAGGVTVAVTAQAARRGAARSRRRDGAAQHGRRAQDPRRRGARRASVGDDRPVAARPSARRARRMSVTVRVPTILRQYTGGVGRGVGLRGTTLGEVLGRARGDVPGHRAAGPRRRGQAAAVRQRLRRRRRRTFRRPAWRPPRRTGRRSRSSRRSLAAEPIPCGSAETPPRGWRLRGAILPARPEYEHQQAGERHAAGRRQVVQQRKGLRLHPGRQRPGRLRALQRDPVRRLPQPRAGPARRVRDLARPEGPPGGPRPLLT